MPDRLITTQDLKELKSEITKEIQKIVNDFNRTRLKKQWLRAYEVQKQLSISPSTLQHLRDRGIIPHSKVGGVYYYHADDIEKVLEKNKRYGS